MYAYQRRLETSRDRKRQMIQPWSQNDLGELKTNKEKFLFKEILESHMLAYTFSPRNRQMGLDEAKVSLVYTMISRPPGLVR